MANRSIDGVTRQLIESQVVATAMRQSPREATDLGGAMELAVHVTGSDFTTDTMTTTVELYHGLRNRAQDMISLATFTLSDTTSTSFTYLTQFGRFVLCKVTQNPTTESSTVEMLAVPKYG